MAAPEAKAPDAKAPEAQQPQDKAPIDHAKDIAAKEIQAMPPSAQREAVDKEWQRVVAQCASSLPELTVGQEKDKHLAVISKDGKAVEIVDESGKTWKADGKNLFSDGQNQRLLMSKLVDGQPAKNADGTPQYDFMPVQTRQVDNGDGTMHSVITQITDAQGRKWASYDGQQFIGAAGNDGAGQAGDQRVLKDKNGSLEFTDPKGGTLSEQAIKAKEIEIQDLIKKSTSPGLFIPDESGSAPLPADVVDGSKLNKVLENSSPELLARYDKDLNLRETLKDKMSSKDYEDMTRILDGAKSLVTAHADRIFANGIGATKADANQAEQETRRVLLQTNSSDMPKLNDDLLKRINADPAEKKQYEQYVEQHKNDPGFDSKNAALLSFSQHFSKETQDAMPLLVKGNDKLDTSDGGTTARAQLVKQALISKDFDLFKTALTGASQETRAAIPGADVDKAFTENRFLSNQPTAESERNLAIAHDLLAKGEVQPSTLIKYSNAEQADKILAGLTPEQRNSYIKGKDNADPNNADHQFYASMQEAFKQASGGDAVKQLKMDDEARKQNGSFVSTLAKHEGMFFNDSGNQIKQDFGSLTEDQRKDLSENYTVRRQQMEDMMKALNRDPKDVLEKFDQFFKKQPNAQSDSDGAAMTLLDKVRTEQAKPQAVIGDEDGSLGAAAKAENVAKALQHGFQDDPGLFARLKNPQTDSEKQLAEMLKDPDKLFGASKDQFEKVATEGKLPLDQALIMDRSDPQQTARDLLGASPEEQKRFLSDPTEAKKWLGINANESNVDQKYDVMKNVLAQGKLQPEDEARAVAIGWKQPEDLKSLSGLNSEMAADYQKKYGEDLQISLLNKFGHQDNSVNDFLSKYNNVFQKSDTLSHDTAVAGSGWASKLLDGHGSMSPQEMTLAATQMADLSAKLQKQLDASPDGATPEIKAFMESQKRLKEAIDNHQDATKQLTETVDKAVNVAITAAIIAGTMGGASVPALMAGIAAGGVGRYAVKDELMGANWKDKDKTKDTFDLAVDTVAQLGATRLLKVAEVFKGIKAGEPLTSAARSELQALGVDEATMSKLSASLEKPSVPELPSSAPRELPPPSTPKSFNAGEDIAKQPISNNNAGQDVVTKPEEVANISRDVKPVELPPEAPTNLKPPSAADIISGKADPAALAELSPKTKEFLFQMAQLGSIGAADAKLKGQNAFEGALEWASIGAAAHGVFAGLERSGIKIKFPESSLKNGEVTGDLPRPEVNDSPTLTTGDGRTITRNGDGWSIDGKPSDIRFSKDGDNYNLEVHEHDNVWTRYDAQTQTGSKVMKTEIGELQFEGSESNVNKIVLNSGDRFEKDASGNWHQMRQSGDQWVATTDDARGAIKDVRGHIVEGKMSLDVTYENSLRTFKDNAWSEQTTAQPETVKPAVGKESTAPTKTEPDALGDQNLRMPAPSEPFSLPKAPEVNSGETFPRTTLPTHAEFDPPIKVPAREPVSIQPNREELPALREKTIPANPETLPSLREPIFPESQVPAQPESNLPAVAKPAEGVPSEKIAPGIVTERPTTTIAPESAGIVTGQVAQILPQQGQNVHVDKAAPPPEKPIDVPPPVSPAPESPDRAPLEPSASLAALATVKNYEGPFHSADRVLQAVLGRRPSFEEVRTLTRAMQEQFKLDHHGQDIKSVGLKHGDQFITAQNAESLLAQVAKTNPELAGQMKSYMQVDHDLGAKLGRPPAIDEVRAVSSQLQHDFTAQSQLQSFAQADAKEWQAYEAAADMQQILQNLEATNARLQQIAQIYKATGKLPPDGIISQRAFPDSAGTLHHNKRVASR